MALESNQPPPKFTHCFDLYTHNYSSPLNKKKVSALNNQTLNRQEKMLGFCKLGNSLKDIYEIIYYSQMQPP